MSLTTRAGFRFFVIASFVIAFGPLVDLAFPSLLKPELQEHFQRAQVTIRGSVTAMASLIQFLASIVALVGLLKFKVWARTLYAVLVALGLVLIASLEELISSGLAAAFMSLAALVSGVVLALMYVEPVKGYFERKET